LKDIRHQNYFPFGKPLTSVKQIDRTPKKAFLHGDLPFFWFLRFFDKRFQKLSQFRNTKETYGRSHPIRIDGKIYEVIPLCHPRQADRLGTSNIKWGQFHDYWIQQKYVNKEKSEKIGL